MTVKIYGLDKLEKKLKKNATLDDVKTVVKKHGSRMQDKIVDNAEFTEGYQTGNTKRSIRGTIKDGGFTYEAGPTTHYSPYLEYGTRFMDAQPFVKPAFEKQKGEFKKDLKDLMK